MPILFPVRFIAPLLAAVLLSACAGTQWPYKMDVRQGNHISQEAVAQLKPGMSQDQVRFIMGSPMLVDAFHPDRWDYVYRFTPGKGPVEQRRVTLFFADGKLQRLEGDVIADTGTPAAAPTPRARTIEIQAPKK